MKNIKQHSEHGTSFMEVLVVTSLMAVIFSGILKQYSGGVSLTHDQNIKTVTAMQAQTVLQTIGAEVRILGNGVPFDQENFDIGDTDLSDPTKTEPLVVASSDASQLTYRINESGKVHLLVTDFDPAVTSVISLTDVDGISVGEEIYLSNSVIAGHDGFWGEVTAVDTTNNTVTIDNSTYVASPGASFGVGSLCEQVSEVLINTSSGAVTRTVEGNSITMSPTGTIAFDYLDVNGNSLTLPLTAANLVDDLRTIEITVTVTSSQVLSDGNSHTAIATQSFGIRNLNYLY